MWCLLTSVPVSFYGGQGKAYDISYHLYPTILRHGLTELESLLFWLVLLARELPGSAYLQPPRAGITGMPSFFSPNMVLDSNRSLNVGKAIALGQ